MLSFRSPTDARARIPSHASNSSTFRPHPFVAPWRSLPLSVAKGRSVARRFRLSALLLAAWMTLIPSVGLAQDCLQWADRTPLGTTGPSPRYAHAMAYDSARGVTVLFGGVAGPPSYKGDTWEWDGTMWTLRSTTGPSGRYGHVMVYDSARGVTVLFGGNDGSYKGDTWEWDGTIWSVRSTTGPSPRLGHAMAYDSARGVSVLFGGWALSTGWKGDTWEWNGTTWTLRSLTGPSPRRWHAMAYDGGRGVTVMFGGEDGYTKGDTWEWD